MTSLGGQQHRLSSSFNDASPRRRHQTALVLGSSGCLGSAVARHLSQDMEMTVIGADLLELPTELSQTWELDGFVALPDQADLPELTTTLLRGVHQTLHDLQGPQYDDDDEDDFEDEDNPTETRGLDVIVVASGAWEGDPEQANTQRNAPRLTDAECSSMIQDAERYMETVERMRRANLDPVLAAGFCAQQLASNDNGLMVVLGATAALSPTPGLMGYGVAKAATHHAVQTWGSLTAAGNAMELPSQQARAKSTVQPHPHMTVIGVLPTTLDTPSNRKAMPKGKFEQWTKPSEIAHEIGQWIQAPALRPHSGSLVRVYQDHKNRKTGGASFELVY